MLPYDEAIRSLPAELQNILVKVDRGIREETTEIRLRTGRPIILINDKTVYFVSENGSCYFTAAGQLTTVSRAVIAECVKTMSEYSLHSVQNSIKNGFITLRGGHRAGLTGSVSWEKNDITSVKQIDCINIRIARQITGAADTLADFYRFHGLKGTLIVGPPASGKTTILKDICKQLSDGGILSAAKVSVIDERGEIAAVYEGQPQNNIGLNADVFDGYSKAIAFDIAIRCMSPEIIICDEIGNSDDADSLLSSVNAGVSVIATVHASSIEELLQKKNLNAILSSGAFQYIVLIDGREGKGKIKEIIQYDKIRRNDDTFFHGHSDRLSAFGRP